MLSNRYLEVSGTFSEMAFQQGQAFRPLQNNILKALQKVPVFPSWIQKRIPAFVYKNFLRKQGKKFLKHHAPIIRDISGTSVLDQFQKMADGFEMDLPFLYGLNSFEILSSELPYTLGCTSLAFAPHHTTDGFARLGYNHDFPTSLGKFLFVRKNNPDYSSYTSLSLTYPSLLGAIGGINEKGLALSLNHAFATDIKPMPALFITLLVQKCLDSCTTVDEALKLIEATPVPNGSMITLIDTSGKRAVVELACTRKGVRRGDETILHTFNKYQIGELEEVEIPLTAVGKGALKEIGIHNHNLSRERRYLQLTNEKGKYSDEDILNLLSDHNEEKGGPFTICRHHPQTADTLASAIFNPVERSMKVIFGFPCSGHYDSYNANRT